MTPAYADTFIRRRQTVTSEKVEDIKTSAHCRGFYMRRQSYIFSFALFSLKELATTDIELIAIAREA